MAAIKFTPEIIARFKAKVSRGTRRQCWPWTAGTQNAGYGTFHIGKVTYSAHRVAWELVRGPIPQGGQICHRCDNPRCCNPEHLFLGSHAANMRDKKLKGRAVRLTGAANGKTIIADAVVVKIFRAYKTRKFTQYRLAALFGVKRSQVADIINRRTHADLTKDL